MNFLKKMDKLEALDKERREQRLELVKPLPETGAPSLPESATVPKTSPVPKSGRDAGASVLSLQQVEMLKQGRKPAALGEHWVSLKSQDLFPARHVKPVRLAQHSMTGGEERFYDALWKLKSDRSIEVLLLSRQHKQIRAGYDLLAQAAGYAVSTTRLLLQQLIEKRVLHSHHDPVCAERRGTLYDLFGYEEILRRQQAAGLCYVVKKGPGVEFAVPEDWTLPEIGGETLPKTDTLPEIGRVLNPDRESLPEISVRSLPEIGRPLDKQKAFLRQSSPAVFAERVKGWLPSLDPAQVDTLWRQAQKQSPTQTSEELATRLLEILLGGLQRGKPLETLPEILAALQPPTRRE